MSSWVAVDDRRFFLSGTVEDHAEIRDLAADAIMTCVGAAFRGLSFPEPKDDVVKVSYPIVFTCSGAGSQ